MSENHPVKTIASHDTIDRRNRHCGGVRYRTALPTIAPSPHYRFIMIFDEQYQVEVKWSGQILI
jgi:hypothetical protein